MAKNLGKQVYLAMNIFPHDNEMEQLESFLTQVSDIGISALIISDIGLASLAKKHTTIPIHASTQASILNSHAASLWQSLGAKRIVLAREASLMDADDIKSTTGLETEMFIHGAMCSSFSGKCTISNVASGRDSNRGDVFNLVGIYQLSNGDTQHVMNSKDLMGLDNIPLYFQHRIDAVKIEGRMKSALYVANACQQYRQAIDAYETNPITFEEKRTEYRERLSEISNRGFTNASLVSPAKASSISYDWNGYSNAIQFAGIVHKQCNNKSLVSAKCPIHSGDRLKSISPKHPTPVPITIRLESLSGQPLTSLMPNQRAWITTELHPHSLLIK